MMDYSRLRNGNDVRGIASEGVPGEEVNLTKTAARDIARGFCLWLQKRLCKSRVLVAVGHDSRISAAELLSGAGQGITESGNDLLITGLSSTPSMFMLLQDAAFFGGENNVPDGAIMLTASHLPFNRNGLKFFTKESGLEADEVKEVLALAGDPYEAVPETARGKAKTESYMDKYAADLVKNVRDACNEETPLKGKKIIVDAGGGAGGFYAEKVLVPLGADIAGSQYLTPDGYFKGHIPNPENEAAMQSICAAVKRVKADFGVIFDTDVDRAGAVDSTGEEINRNRLIALISAILLSVTSDGLAEFIAAHGGKHRRFKRGYKNVINEAIRLNAAGEYTPLAIETSGHAALKENYFLDDGAYLVTRIIIKAARLRKEGQTLASLIAALQEPVESVELRFSITEPDFRACGERILAALEAYAEKQGWQLADDSREGVRVSFGQDQGNGWFLLRLSVHDPVMPLNIESDEAGGCAVIAGRLADFLKTQSGLDLTAIETYLNTL